MAKPRTAPGWAIALRGWANQTSTRSGLVFIVISAAGYSLTEDEITAIAAVPVASPP